ncbi:MAG: hypothetical protein HYX48_07890 [Chlamydiales bacterium]|nr:hypothetical protein [Chlamydiales bacterium]
MTAKIGGKDALLPCYAMSSSVPLFGCVRRQSNGTCINGQRQDQTVLNTLVCELFFAGTLVVALAELVIRAVLTLPGLFVGLFMSDETGEAIRQFTWVGTKISCCAALAAFYALGKNLSSAEMQVKDVVHNEMMRWAYESPAATPAKA